MENERRLLAAAIFALAAAYFLTNLHKATPQQTANDVVPAGVYIHNTITGSVTYCRGTACAVAK
jgi:hypothetical protein